MEPMDIDWRNIDSRFVLDELFEHINAPKWIDLSASGSSSSLIDDEAWFCRPDCRHPKTADDFKVKDVRLASDSEVMPLGERNRRDAANLKRRGILSSLHGTRPDLPRSKKTPKKFLEDSENQNPNCSPLPDMNRAIKASIKSSAEKKPSAINKTSGSDLDEALLHTEQRLPPPRLKSTLSARNLFAGKEILNQITEFCNELKKLAVTTRERENSARVEGKEKEEEPLMEERGQISGAGGRAFEEKRAVAGKEKAVKTMNSKIFSPQSWKKKKRPAGLENIQATATELNGGSSSNGDESFSQVRSCPPTPQRFPSPYDQKKSAKITSPKLSKLRTAEQGILQEFEQTEKVMKESVDEEDNRSILVPGTEEARSLDMFWFLKPCAYLAK